MQHQAAAGTNTADAHISLSAVHTYTAAAAAQTLQVPRLQA
jgi:uncharacterized protein YcnI